MRAFNVRCATACGAMFTVLASGCLSPEPKPAHEPNSKVEDQLAESGIERVIPIHFALLKSSATSPKLELTDMQRMIREANFVFRPAGIQFYISAIDEYVTPSLANVQSVVPWSSVVDDIKKIFQGVPTTLSSPSGNELVMEWLVLASSNWGPKDEIFISATELPVGGSNIFGIEPWMGRGFSGPKDELKKTGTFVHELGHYFGLPHNWQIPEDPSGFTPTDPETGMLVTMDDYWDLIYGFEAQPRFFASRDDAVAYAGEKRTKDKASGGNEAGSCTQNDATTRNVTCNLDVLGGGTVSVTTGQPGGEGMGFIFAGDNPPISYVRGVNIEVYFGIDLGDATLNNTQRYFGISTSQARMIRKHLRFRTMQRSGTGVVANDTPQPTYRDLLGKYTGNQSLSYKLDFDGDGKRDIAVFRPPSTAVPGDTGQFLIRTSAGGAAGSGSGSGGVGGRIGSGSGGRGGSGSGTGSAPYATVTTVNFGTIGDVPVPADYDGDGKTDIAVWRTMGPNGTDPTDARGFWIWCPSSTNPTCATPPTVGEWGVRGDIPLPGTNFDGNAATGEVAVYRPSNSTFYWNVSPFNQGAWTSLTTAGEGAVPMVGLFDGDNQTDVVVFNPSSTTFSYLLSGSGWGSEGVRTFPLAPAATGGPNSQRAPFPVTTYTTGGKQVFSLWDPNTGVYHTMWNPLTSNAIDPCPWGIPSDIPVGTGIDRNNDGRSDRLIRRNEPNSGNVTIYFDSAFQSCGANYLARGMSGLSQRAMVFSTMDSSGDGKPDVWSFDPDTMVWGYLTSQSDFFNGVGPFQLGQPKDLPL